MGKKKKIVKKRKHKIKKKHFMYSKVFLGLMVAFVLLVVVLSFVEFVNFSDVLSVFDKPTVVEIPDECSLIMGNLVHQIRDEDDCSIRCYNECILEEKERKSSEFIYNEGGCHECFCSCK